MKFTSRQYGIIALALITGILHLAAAVDKQLFPDGPDPLFILNGLGYLGLLGAYFLPIPLFQKNHNLVRQGFIGYTILTILAWIVIWVGFSVIRDHIPFFSHDSVYGVPAKIAEVFLLMMLRSDR
jgi:hypothetical protein